MKHLNLNQPTVKKRSEQIMLDLILKIANEDARIRAVILNGSRANPAAVPDMFQDYDIIYLVTELEAFVENNAWHKQFGEILIMQKPDECDGTWPACKDKFTYLMLFNDHNRIDLTLFNINKLNKLPKDSQSILLLDKDKTLPVFAKPSDSDYWPKPPTKIQFFNCCNEFAWVSTYVAKGLWRKQLTYAKYTAEEIIKKELIKMLTWHIGSQTNFQKTIGTHGRNLQKLVEPSIWQQFLATYAAANYNDMWDALFNMCELFNSLALKVAQHFGFVFKQDEFDAVVGYLNWVRTNSY